MDCPLYGEGRNLEAWGMMRDGVRELGFVRVLDDPDRFSALSRFVGVLFEVRRGLNQNKFH